MSINKETDKVMKIWKFKKNKVKKSYDEEGDIDNKLQDEEVKKMILFYEDNKDRIKRQ